MKALLVPEVRKSVPKKLTFTESDFLGLVNFAVFDRFLILPPTLPPTLLLLAPPTIPKIS